MSLVIAVAKTDSRRFKHGTWSDHAETKRGKPRIGECDCVRRSLKSGLTFPDSLHGEIGRERDVDLRAQPIESETLDQLGSPRRRAIDEKAAVALGNEKLVQDLALGGQQCRIDCAARRAVLHVVADKALEKAAGFGPADGDHRTVRKDGRLDHGLPIVEAVLDDRRTSCHNFCCAAEKSAPAWYPNRPSRGGVLKPAAPAPRRRP